jgi:serine O-acetyltransferase
MDKFTKKTDEISKLVSTQLKSNFGLEVKEESQLKEGVKLALASCEYCFARINSKYFKDENGSVIFNPFHSGQYTIFLYYLSRLMYTKKLCSELLLDKLYYLNRMLNSVDLYYKVELPRVFFVDHPLGSVIGRAKIGNNFSFQQNCTVGNSKGVYPILLDNVIMLTGSSIVGNCQVGSKTIFAAHSFIKDINIPNNSLVVGRYPSHRVIPLNSEISEIYFERFTLAN